MYLQKWMRWNSDWACDEMRNSAIQWNSSLSAACHSCSVRFKKHLRLFIEILFYNPILNIIIGRKLYIYISSPICKTTKIQPCWFLHVCIQMYIYIYTCIWYIKIHVMWCVCVYICFTDQLFPTNLDHPFLAPSQE